VLVAGKPANLERLAAALSEFGAPSHVVAAARTMKATDVVFLGVPPVRVDILRTADGIDTEAAITRAVSVQLGELAIKVLSLVGLIANKRAAGRPQDLADVALERCVRGRLPSLLERVQARGAKT
jgi:hypothetical protein